MRLQQQVLQHGITIHFIVLNTGGERVGSVAGALQTQVGLALTKLSHGRYESIAAATRLTTLAAGTGGANLGKQPSPDAPSIRSPINCPPERIPSRFSGSRQAYPGCASA